MRRAATGRPGLAKEHKTNIHENIDTHVYSVIVTIIMYMCIYVFVVIIIIHYIIVIIIHYYNNSNDMHTMIL